MASMQSSNRTARLNCLTSRVIFPASILLKSLTAENQFLFKDIMDWLQKQTSMLLTIDKRFSEHWEITLIVSFWYKSKLSWSIDCNEPMIPFNGVLCKRMAITKGKLRLLLLKWSANHKSEPQKRSKITISWDMAATKSVFALFAASAAASAFLLLVKSLAFWIDVAIDDDNRLSTFCRSTVKTPAKFDKMRISLMAVMITTKSTSREIVFHV